MINQAFFPASYFFVEENGNAFVFYLVPFNMSFRQLRLKNDLKLVQNETEDMYLQLEEEKGRVNLLLPVDIISEIFNKLQNNGDLTFWIVVGRVPEQKEDKPKIEKAQFTVFSLSSLEIAKLIGYLAAYQTQPTKKTLKDKSKN